MKILLTGICGFVGSTVAETLRRLRPDWSVAGVDNFIRSGSETNAGRLKSLGVEVLYGDIRATSDVDALPAANWLIDAAANPSVLAGVDGKSSSRQVVEHNLLGTVNLLEYCRRHAAGCVLLSTSRVYSIPLLAGLPVEILDDAFRLRADAALPPGISAAGVSEGFSVAAPVSLYGATKLASETLALEYGASFGFPVWINRCGVLAGAGQFGRADQGILAYWINAWLRCHPLRYIGFGGNGTQVRDAFHPGDLAELLVRQIECAPEQAATKPRVVNVGGGTANVFSLATLSAWCRQRFGDHPITADPQPRAFDIPWMVMDNTLVRQTWGWQPHTPLDAILDEVAQHAGQHPDWLEMSAGR